MRHRRIGRTEWTARFAVLLLVAQAVLLAFSSGAAAGSAVRDQFGNVICSPDGSGGHRSPSSHDRHAGGLDCCTVGCPMFGGPPPSPIAAATAIAQPLALFVSFALHENLAAADVTPSPRSARAPPPSA